MDSATAAHQFGVDAELGPAAARSTHTGATSCNPSLSSNSGTNTTVANAPTTSVVGSSSTSFRPDQGHGDQKTQYLLLQLTQSQQKLADVLEKGRTPPSSSVRLKTGPEALRAVAAAAAKKGNSTVLQLLLLAFIAGGYIAVGTTLAVTVGGGMGGVKTTDPGLQSYIFASFGVPFGLCMILVAGGNLLTGDLMIMPVGVLSGTATPRQLVKVWLCSLCGNFFGALVVVAVLVDWAGLPSGEMQQNTAKAVATKKALHNFGELVLRGIGCNWMVCMAVWLSFMCHTLTEKVVACWMCVATFIAIGWSHSVVNMALLPLGWLLDADFEFWEYLVKNLLPVTLGNVIGAQFIGLVYFYLYSAPKRTPTPQPVRYSTPMPTATPHAVQN